MWGIILKILLPLLVDIALKWGLPKVLEWLINKFPKMPVELRDKILAVVNKAVADAEGYDRKSMHAKAVRHAAKMQVKECLVGCEADTKGLD